MGTPPLITLIQIKLNIRQIPTTSCFFKYFMELRDIITAKDMADMPKFHTSIKACIE